MQEEMTLFLLLYYEMVKYVIITPFFHSNLLYYSFPAYLKHGDYNVFLIDWAALSRPPCYMAAVHNLHSTSHCVANHFIQLRNSGLNVEKTTCVGHSLGAHVCGIMANYLNFRIERIIALDPARPLIRPGSKNRLDVGDAKSVQVNLGDVYTFKVNNTQLLIKGDAHQCRLLW